MLDRTKYIKEWLWSVMFLDLLRNKGVTNSVKTKELEMPNEEVLGHNHPLGI